MQSHSMELFSRFTLNNYAYLQGKYLSLWHTFTVPYLVFFCENWLQWKVFQPQKIELHEIHTVKMFEHVKKIFGWKKPNICQMKREKFLVESMSE